mmetsp:Transcript_41143/g.102351  ORF Transcript_41143/g.102351 Transcript_41143/m.102351 type:complete len:272 (-) Transcript_41143:326-1141(-)
MASSFKFCALHCCTTVVITSRWVSKAASSTACACLRECTLRRTSAGRQPSFTASCSRSRSSFVCPCRILRDSSCMWIVSLTRMCVSSCERPSFAAASWTRCIRSLSATRSWWSCSTSHIRFWVSAAESPSASACAHTSCRLCAKSVSLAFNSSANCASSRADLIACRSCASSLLASRRFAFASLGAPSFAFGAATTSSASTSGGAAADRRARRYPAPRTREKRPKQMPLARTIGFCSACTVAAGPVETTIATVLSTPLRIEMTITAAVVMI